MTYKIGCQQIGTKITDTTETSVIEVPIDLAEGNRTVGVATLRIDKKHLNNFDKKFINLIKLMIKE